MLDSLHGSLRLASGPRTDFFAPPGGAPPLASAAAELVPVVGDFVLSARVEVAFAATFDAGALFLWGDERRWAKLAFELSPQGERMVVSVVTRDRSDDCNSAVVDADHVWLRAARLGEAYAFHSSADGKKWDFVRHFHLAGDVQAGLEVQSPTGDGCEATFTEIRFEQRTLGDLRDGS